MARSHLSVDFQQKIEHVATTVLLNTGLSHTQLREADADQLLSLQSQLLMGHEWGVWQVAPELISRRAVHDSIRTFRLELAVPGGMDPDSARAREVWCELLRIAIAGRLWPGASGRRRSYSTILTDLRYLGLVTRHIAAIDQPGFWARATREQVQNWIRSQGPAYTSLLARLKKQGVIADSPKGRERPGRSSLARDRTGEPEHKSQLVVSEKYQPFPDAFVSAAGWNAIQMIRIVGPTLLDALEAASTTEFKTHVDDSRSARHGQPLGPRERRKARADALDPIIANWNWRMPDGTPLQVLPMNARFSARSTGEVSWPPRTHHEAWAFLTVLQASHLWPVALASAGRHGEVLSLEEGCIRRESTETPTGIMHTWKLDGISGRGHEVPVPDLVVTALRQQERLARLVKRVTGVSGKHLWVMTSVHQGKPQTTFRGGIDALVSTFDLAGLLEGSNAHMHRFRKTLVRIVALALVHAPKILMDVLGHRDEQMTVMRYILSDPGLLNEIQETVRELIVLKGVEVVVKRDQLQGKAAPVLRERVSEYAKRVGASAMEPQNLMEFVRAMTEGGTGWAVIAPGIICTSFTRGGMCNKGQGGANPHYCNPACDNQLVMNEFEEDGIKVASAVTRAIETLDYMHEKLRSADENGEDMLMAQFSGQIKALLGRWRDVDRHFSEHPVLKRHLPNVVLLS